MADYEKYVPRKEEKGGNSKLEPFTDNISPAQIVDCTTEFYRDICSSGEMVKH